ncbi:MAG TPA: hypothetical protein DC047_10195 [Blastocatellia bacterium]|nr:hypothetical protein [Blastocatellia bacterium]
MCDILFGVELKGNADPSRVGELFCPLRDPRVPREARFTLGHFFLRLQRFDSTRCARYLLQPTRYRRRY